MKIIYVTADKEVNVKAIFAVKNTTRTVVKIRPEKNSALYRNWTHDLCDTGQCSTNWAYKLCFYLIVCMRTCKQIRLHFYKYIYIYIRDNGKTFLKNSFPKRSKKLRAKLLLLYLSSGKVPTSRSVNNHVRKNHFNVETAMECNQTTDRQPSFGGDGTLQQISGIKILCF